MIFKLWKKIFQKACVMGFFRNSQNHTIMYQLFKSTDGQRTCWRHLSSVKLFEQISHDKIHGSINLCNTAKHPYIIYFRIKLTTEYNNTYNYGSITFSWKYFRSFLDILHMYYSAGEYILNILTHSRTISRIYRITRLSTFPKIIFSYYFDNNSQEVMSGSQIRFGKQ